MVGFDLHAHRLFGPPPLAATYVCYWEIHLSELLLQASSDFLMLLASAAQFFDFHMDDRENAFPGSLVPSVDPDVTFFSLVVETATITVLGDSGALSRLTLQEGLQINLQNLINKRFSKKIIFEIPTIELIGLSSREGKSQGDESFWVEVFNMTTKVSITMFQHYQDWESKRNAQQSFIKEQDDITYRCSFLYENIDADFMIQGKLVFLTLTSWQMLDHIEFRQPLKKWGKLHVPALSFPPIR